MAGLLVPAVVYAPPRPAGFETVVSLEVRDPKPLAPVLTTVELDAQTGVRERLEAQEVDGGLPGRVDQIFPEQYSALEEASFRRLIPAVASSHRAVLLEAVSARVGYAIRNMEVCRRDKSGKDDGIS